MPEVRTLQDAQRLKEAKTYISSWILRGSETPDD
jgi:hypothetical protein